MTRALVLGGGGTVGIAWETGLLHSLQANGVDVGSADLVVGTSAGSVVGTQITLGMPLDMLLAVQLAPLNTARDQPAAVDTSVLATVHEKLTEPVAATPELLREIGALSLSASTITEEEYLQRFEMLRGVPWPQRQLLITAVNTHNGAFQVWKKNGVASIIQAVASSCSVPGIFPPITVEGQRYMDGGMRSATNADLAAEHDVVVIIAPITVQTVDVSVENPSRLKREVEELRARGRHVEVIVPDAETLAVFGPNLMDTTRRIEAARAGIRQGQQTAASLREIWQ